MYAACNEQNIAGTPTPMPLYYMLSSFSSKKNLSNPGEVRVARQMLFLQLWCGGFIEIE
jgi:hypothetical protein